MLLIKMHRYCVVKFEPALEKIIPHAQGYKKFMIILKCLRTSGFRNLSPMAWFFLTQLRNYKITNT